MVPGKSRSVSSFKICLLTVTVVLSLFNVNSISLITILSPTLEKSFEDVQESNIIKATPASVVLTTLFCISP